MSVRQFVPPKSLNEMREAGRELEDKAVFEIDLSTGNVTWANQFALAKLGYVQEQIRSMTVYDLVPEEFHDKVSDNIADKASGKQRKFSLWPIKTPEGKLAWWYIYQAKTEYPISWSFAEFIQITGKDGPAYAFMRVTMDTTNHYGALHSRVDELDEWVHEQVERLDIKDSELQSAVNDLAEKMKHVISASMRAANASLEAASAVRELKEDVKNQLGQHEEEILKLISTDVHHDRRIEAFEKHVKATTDRAMQSITTQADKAGRGLSKKIVIPVSTIAAIATLIQWLITHFLKP